MQEGMSFVTFGRNMSVRKNTGFTLMELLTAVGIISVLSAFGYPAMTNLMSKGRMERGATTMALSVSGARSDAMTKARYTSLYAGTKFTPANMGNAALPSGYTSEQAWSEGWRQLARTLTAVPNLSATGTMTDQVFLGFVPSNKGNSVRVLLVDSGTNPTPAALGTAVSLDVISFDRYGQLVDEVGGIRATKEVQIWVCDNGRTGEKGQRLVVGRRGNVTNIASSATGYVNPCT